MHDRQAVMKKGRSSLKKRYLYRGICAVLITALVSLSFFEVWFPFVRVNNQTGHLTGIGNLLMAVIIYAVVFIVFMHSLGGFKIGINRRTNVIVAQIVALFLTDFSEIMISAAITGQWRFWNQFLLRYSVLFIGQSVAVTVITVVLIFFYQKLFPPLQVLEIVGEYQNKLESKFDARPDKYHVSTVMVCTEDTGTMRNAILQADAVLLNDLPGKIRNQILKYCFETDKRVYFTPKISDILVRSADELNVFDTPVYLRRNMGMSWSQRFLKRAFDIVFSVFFLILTSPVLLITAAAIRLEDGGPVFFRQERGTIYGKSFMIWKFRSMIVDAEKDGRPHPAEENDDRITKVGRVIRKTRIDELPQLFNILKGEMSVVGPRPERLEHVRAYTSQIPEFVFREKVKGGLTGYAQIYGKYNTTALDKLKLDMIYITNYSFLLDLQIILETIKVVFSRESTEGFEAAASAALLDDQTKEE